MREILFRAKRVEDNQWVEGHYVSHQKRVLCPIGDELKKEDVDHYIFFDSFADWNMPRTLTFVKIKPETLGQYTGKLDVEGKRIFEGDILNIMLYGKNLKVVWWQAVCGFGLNDKDEKGLLFMNEVHSNGIDVIGNIYDNPELMEK